VRATLKLYVVSVLAAAVAATLVFAPGIDPARLPLSGALLLMATFGQLRPIHLTQKMKMTVDDTATFAAALLLSPALAFAVAAGSTLLAYTRRREAPWFESVFNAATSGLATLAAATLFGLLGGDSSSVASYAAAAAAAGIAKYIVQTTLVDVAVALQLRRNLIATWWPVHRRDLVQSFALYAIGALMAIVADVYPLATVLFVLPVAAVFLSMRETARLRTQTREAIVEMAKLIDLRDRYTHGHSQRVADLAARIAGRLGMESSQVELIHEAGLLHDLGKIRTPDHVLQKPGPLDREECVEMRLHAEAGADLLRRLPEFWEGASLVRAHHEHYDGSGYPRGLAGSEIPLEAAVIAVADAWDAMTSDRPYRKALTVTEARGELMRHRGSQWAPRVVDALLAIVNEPVAMATGGVLASAAKPA
jgi:putative nucleotidyltransferase with HDIG domain